ncbi:hypothetical protein CCUS01_11252 [Colletotrichum cuscutae]|uniref:Uncharacterized protein n=1 Tax=Colletotrichum cuscutae TaxID=1209917 RepID=A0AAI9XJB2_9PEZI|nr:hypothetical protein CCUS01_11252 [Colletotrichum cuscutae]
MVKKILVPFAGRQTQQDTSSEPDKSERNAGTKLETQAQMPLRFAVAETRILSDGGNTREPCCVCTSKDDMEGVLATQFVDIDGQGTTYISLTAGENSRQVVHVRGNARTVIADMKAGDGSTQLICASDNEDSLRKVLEIALAPRRSIRRDPKHLHPAQISDYLPDILCLSSSRGTGPVFGGLRYQGDRWECFLFDQYTGAEGSTENKPFQKLLDEAGMDLETWICLVVFASLLAQCAEYEGQMTLCPNWLWAKQKAIFGSKLGQPQATLYGMLSLLRAAPVCPVRAGSWTKSCLVGMWHAARQERCQMGIEQDIRTIRAVKGCFLDEGPEMYSV